MRALAGNTKDCKTLRMFLDKIEKQYCRARRVWVMDRGIPIEAVLAEMRASDPPVQYLVGTPKGRFLVWKNSSWTSLGNKPAKASRSNCWQNDGELYCPLKVTDRVAQRERAMRRRQLKWVVEALYES